MMVKILSVVPYSICELGNYLVPIPKGGIIISKSVRAQFTDLYDWEQLYEPCQWINVPAQFKLKRHGIMPMAFSVWLKYQTRYYSDNSEPVTAEQPDWSAPQVWAMFQYPTRRLIVRSHNVSKLLDLYSELSKRSEIRQAHRQWCCWCVCQISKRNGVLN